jgi:hypothetical protein
VPKPRTLRGKRLHERLLPTVNKLLKTVPTKDLL